MGSESPKFARSDREFSRSELRPCEPTTMPNIYATASANAAVDKRAGEGAASSLLVVEATANRPARAQAS
jgi:hypothetical protein